MSDFEPYEIVDDRIIPIRSEGWVKDQPDAESFSDALEKILETTGLDDAGLTDHVSTWVERVARNIAHFHSAYYIDPEEALFLLIGVIPSYASYLFEWDGQVYFTMRPDFGFQCIKSNFNVAPLNIYESKIQQGFLDVACTEVEAIYRAIRNGELLKNGETQETFDKWMSFFEKRGFDISHIPQEYLSGLITGLKKENGRQVTQAKTPFLDENHQFYAKELKIAVEAWTALYVDNPPPNVPKGGHKKYIYKWLEENHPDLGQRAQDRIAIVINPNPKGGASPIGWDI